MTFKRTVSDAEIARRRAELDSIMREIHQKMLDLVVLRKRKGLLCFSIRNLTKTRTGRKTAADRARDRRNCRAYRARKKAKRLANPYGNRRYDDVRMAA